jgi:hypothetical protein
MRPISFGLVAAMVLAALVAATSAAAADAPMAAATPLVAAAHMPCTVSDARFIGDMTLADGGAVKAYEVACQEGLGYVLIAKTKGSTPPDFFDCFAASRPDAKGKPSPTACKLPANANPSASLQSLVDKSGHGCPIDKARAIGTGGGKGYYEIACKSGQGLVLITSQVAGGPAPVADDCLAIAGSGAIQCELTTRAQELAVVDPLIAASGAACAIKDRRFVGTMTNGDTYYEVACADGKGYMVSSDASGKFSQAITCGQAVNIADGCTLTDSRKAQTEESALYAQLAKKAGFDCQVSKYAVFPTREAGKEVVELQCANRPDGGVGIFPASGAPVVYDCLRSENYGFRCTMTDTTPLYPKLSAQLKAKNKGSCVVSGARSYAATTTSDLVEVACSDGLPGWVIEYPTNGANPSDLLNCTQAANIGGGGCQLPTNRKN